MAEFPDRSRKKFQNKDIDGGVADNEHRITLPSNTTTNLAALGRKEGTIAYDTTQQLVVIDKGAGFVSVGGGGGGSVVNVTASSPLISSGGTTPNISLPNADATHNGYLTNTDWTTFNNKQNSLTIGNISDAGTDGIVITGGTSAVIGSGVTVAQTKSDATHNGYLSSVDWSNFNNKLSSTQGNYISNSDAEINTAGWNLYNNSGRSDPAFVVAQDITWTSVATGNAGNGINIDYVYNAGVGFATPLVTVVTPTHITIGWNNGPTIANNPTATQLKAAFDAVPAATAIATATITGISTNRQYITGSNILANGGDTAPVAGTGGVIVGETITRNTVAPLVGVASFDLGKDAVSRQGEGVSTDFTIDSAFTGQSLQISFFYNASAGFVLGTASDVKVFLYDITNANMLPVSISYLKGPTVGTTYRFAGQFTAASNSTNYRLILHTATTNATAWDLKFDQVTVNSVLDASSVTSSPSLVLPAQHISGAVNNDNGPMVVQWLDGATQWTPAVNTGTDPSTMYGFAKNIIGLTADITVRGYCNGFSFGPFAGYNQYIDNTAGLISPLPSPFRDTYVTVGKAISSTELNVQFWNFFSLVNHAKGSLLTSTGANNGNGDSVLAVAANGNVLSANSAAANGINWAPAVIAAAPFTYTLATRTLTIATATNAVAGIMSAADHTLLSGAAPTASPAFTGTPTSSGDIQITAIGKGLQIKTGTNAKIGTAVLVGGTVTVANTSVTANSRIFVTSNTDGGTPGWLRVSAKTVGTSFVITSSSGTDTSTVAWIIVESIP